MTAQIIPFPVRKKQAALDAITRVRLTQEAIEEFMLEQRQFDLGDVVARVNEWEKLLTNTKA